MWRRLFGIPPPFCGVTNRDADKVPPSAKVDSYQDLALPTKSASRNSLTLEPLPSSSPHESLRLSPELDALESEEGGRWSARCKVKLEDGGFWLEPLTQRPLSLNGLPLSQTARLSSGDVVGFHGAAFRVVMTGQPGITTAVTEAEVFAADVQAGMLEVEEGPGLKRLRLRWRWDASTLADFGRTALARSATSLEVVVCRGEGPTVDAGTVVQLASALGPLAEKTTFVIPASLGELRGMVHVRVAPAVDVRFDGQLVSLSSPLWLTAGAEGLELENTFSPAPALFALNDACFLSCEEGWGSLESIGRANARAVITPCPRFQLPLLAGDEWRLQCGGRTHQLKVEAASGSQPVPRTWRAPRAFVFEGDELRSVTLMLQAEDAVFKQGSDGLFRGPGHEVFGVSAPGKLGWLRSQAPAFTVYEHTAGGLALPSPSAFLRGRTPFPQGRLTRDRLEVFLDQLLERQDGAALALSQIVRGEASERPQWFARMLVSPAHRHKLKGWLLQERETLGLFAPELHLSQPEFAGPVLHAIATEPLFGYLREVKVDVEDSRWLDFMRFVGAIPHVRVAGCKHGEELVRFEPGPGAQLDAQTSRFYERHL